MYRTDKRIGQALGNVPENLVAYWRRKKGIGRPSFPKYSLAEIKELWERYGDDYKAGQQLEITKQAFYRWRKKYKLLDRPAILKLEQLELKFYDEQRLSRKGEKQPVAQTFLQKIVTYHHANPFVAINEGVRLPADLVVSVDGLGIAVRCHSRVTGKGRRRKPDIARFDSILDMIETGHFVPGRVIAANRLEAAAFAVTASHATILPDLKIAAEGGAPVIDLKVLPSLKLTVSGNVALRLSPFDMACQIAEAQKMTSEEDYLLELSGPPIERLTLEERVALLSYLALLSTPNVFIEPDQTFLGHLQRLGEATLPVPFSDKNAHHLDRIDVLLSRRRPRFYAIKQRKFLSSYNTLAGKKLKRVRVGPLVGGTLENIRTLAAALKGEKLSKTVEVCVIPATRSIFVDAARKRFVQHLVAAGVRVGNIRAESYLVPLDAQEYELTTEIEADENNSFLASIERISQAVQAGKLTKKLFESV
ncbi:MAG: hypothetical protein KAT58_01245 [candidate division Zixibacteria bacterium]|nr:hypothetical protein [candidate division Zixibacteria bacterium]